MIIIIFQLTQKGIATWC